MSSKIQNALNLNFVCQILNYDISLYFTSLIQHFQELQSETKINCSYGYKGVKILLSKF